ncbi:MAG: winged helix-turn-helix domain-containing protein, partial [Parvularcula sp.]|nr:winged helix-turn-helix domain-containing protein [Parvularcula sp.]
MTEKQPVPEDRLLIADGLELDCGDRQARLNGEDIALSAKPFALLAAMMEAAPRVTTKDQLIQAGWGQQAVSDAVVTTAMKEIRQALGDKARAPEWIETKHGLGYRFLKPVTKRERLETVPEPVEPASAEAAALPGPTPRPDWVRYAPFAIGIVVCAALILWLAGKRAPDLPPLVPKSVVALPFRPLDEESAALASAMSEEVATTLNRTPDVTVAGSALTQRFAAAGEGADLAARRGGFGHLLGGTVR